MLFELIAVIAAGFAAAGLVLLADRLARRRLPRWLVPVAAGAAMIAVTLYSEYSWYGRTEAALPESLVVVRTVEDRAPYRPWTYLAPYVSRFMAVDQGSIRSNEAIPDQRMVDLLLFGRWAPVRQVPVLVDCVVARRADLVDGADFAPDGRVENARWVPLDPEGALLQAACVAP